MDKSAHYYFCLIILDILDHETRRTARGSAHLGDELRTLMYSTMTQVAPPGGFYLGIFRQLRDKVDEYFGDGEAMKLMEMVVALWDLANTHMVERATNGPYTHEPYEFDNVIGIPTLPDPDSRTRVWYTRRR